MYPDAENIKIFPNKFFQQIFLKDSTPILLFNVRDIDDI